MFKMYASIILSIILISCSDGSDAHVDDLDEVAESQCENCSPQHCLINQKPVDCTEIYENGFKKSGVYEIYPKHRSIGCVSFKVYCDMETDGGGWTVIQKRGDFNRPIDYFFKTWDYYKKGFGGLGRDFWLGNDYIHVLTNQKSYSVRFDLKSGNETTFALYDSFWIDNEEDKYKLHISGYGGTAGDSMSYHNNHIFSTKDQPGKNNCPNSNKGGWWYDDCYYANLNGFYRNGIVNEDVRDAIIWYHWKGNGVSLSEVEIKIRPLDF